MHSPLSRIALLFLSLSNISCGGRSVPWTEGSDGSMVAPEQAVLSLSHCGGENVFQSDGIVSDPCTRFSAFFSPSAAGYMLNLSCVTEYRSDTTHGATSSSISFSFPQAPPFPARWNLHEKTAEWTLGEIGHVDFISYWRNDAGEELGKGGTGQIKIIPEQAIGELQLTADPSPTMALCLAVPMTWEGHVLQIWVESLPVEDSPI